MKSLSSETINKINSLCDKGDEYAETGNFDNALKEYWNVFSLIPEPKTDYEITGWVLVAIGDTNFISKKFNESVENLTNALHCPGALLNPYLHLRLGQCYFELGSIEMAIDQLYMAYVIEGKSIFIYEDPKYFSFLKTKIKLEENYS